MVISETQIPKEKLPQCWSDDVRMNALFAPFRLKSANPESWEMKMKFWSDMLRVWCRCKDDPIVSAADAKVAFQRNGRTPACLDIVVEELFRNNELSPIMKYQQILHNGPESWVRWGARLAFKPASLAITAVSFLMPTRQALDSDGLPKASIESTQRFVLESAVEEQAKDLLLNYPTGQERIGTIEELMKYTERKPSQREAFEILLGYLINQGMAAKQDCYVKLAEPNKRVDPISDWDASLARLLSAEAAMCADAERARCAARDAAAAAAAAALHAAHRTLAKNHLRRKHKLLQSADRSEAALENIRQMIHNMRDMAVNKSVVDTYKHSAAAMKQNMAVGGLDGDTVHDTMDDLKEVLENYSEVEKALSRPVTEEDASDLEAELAELLASSPGGNPGGSTSRRDASFTLPSPPSSQPRRVNSEKDFVFDGEAQMLAELESLDADVGSPAREKETRRPVKVAAEGWSESKTDSPKVRPSKCWYPPESEFTNKSDLDKSIDKLCNSFEELRTDQRLHPGQKLDVDFTRPPALYNKDFTVQDHALSDRVWLYNCRDQASSEGDVPSTDYISSESPGKSPSSAFQMAPGGERRRQSETWRPENKDSTVDDLQRRLDNLRGYQL